MQGADSGIQAEIGRILETLLAGAGEKVENLSVQDGRADVVIAVDPAKGAALEPLRQKIQAALEKVSGIDVAQVVLTAAKASPPELAVRGQKQAGGFSHKISARPVAPDVRHIVAVASGKGGVGKSTVAANLAAALTLMGKKTGLLDADIYGASQPAMMGLREKPAADDDGMIAPLQKDIAGHPLSLMSMGFFVDPLSPVIWRGPMVHSAIQQLFRDVRWGDLDVLVVDLPPGTGDAQLSLAQYVPLSGAVIVSTPQDVALEQAKKGFRMFEKTNVPVLGLIENMSYHQCTACGHRDHIFAHGAARAAAAELGVPFWGEVPLQTDIRAASDAGLPIVAAQPSHPTAEIFMNMAARLYASLPATRPTAKKTA